MEPPDATFAPLGDPPFAIDQSMARAARERLAPYNLRLTRVVESPELAARYGGRPVYLKCESEQVTGSFKVRGALNRVAALDAEERPRGVVAASAGNHALGLAWSCRLMGVPGLVVVPEGVAQVKLDRLREMTIKVRVQGGCYDEAEAHARQIAAEAGATFVSPFDDPWVMAGNGGTVGLELAEQIPGLGAVVTPLGGGGLAAGLAAALPEVPVLGVNTEASPAMARSLAEGRVYLRYPSAPTIAEGLEGGVSPASAALCARLLHGVPVVAEASLAAAIRFAARRHAMVIEGSAAAGLAALLEGQPIPGHGPICVVLTGRNIDGARLRAILGQ